MPCAAPASTAAAAMAGPDPATTVRACRDRAVTAGGVPCPDHSGYHVPWISP